MRSDTSWPGPADTRGCGSPPRARRRWPGRGGWCARASSDRRAASSSSTPAPASAIPTWWQVKPRSCGVTHRSRREARRHAMSATATRIHIPAREGRALRLPAGSRFKITDLQGKQCCDLFAFDASNVGEYASAEHTRVYNGNLFPRVGQPFVTARRRPILLFEADHTPGKHDMLVAACNPSRYALLGVKG